MTYAVSPPPRPTLPIDGSDELFPVRRVYCIGRNYAAHAREMGQDDREPPFFFLKPADAVVAPGAPVPYPPQTRDLHHEIELVVAIGGEARNVTAEQALDTVYGYAVGIDLTRRDLQIIARDKGRPWEIGKAFDHSAPCSAIRPASTTGHPAAGRIWLARNGMVKQDGDLGELNWGVAEIIATLSATATLMPGDLVFTGTPAGVGPVEPGDMLTGGVAGVGEIRVEITGPA